MDLFNTPNQIPDNIQVILSSYNEDVDPYNELERILTEVELRGYTFDYFLDGIPFNLMKIQE